MPRVQPGLGRLDEDHTPWDIGDQTIDLGVKEVTNAHKWEEPEPGHRRGIGDAQQGFTLEAAPNSGARQNPEKRPVAGQTLADIQYSSGILHQGLRFVEDHVDEMTTENDADSVHHDQLRHIRRRHSAPRVGGGPKVPNADQSGDKPDAVPAEPYEAQVENWRCVPDKHGSGN